MWHKVLGYCNVADIKILEGTFQVMITCILTKQVNVRSKHAGVQAACPFELVHKIHHDVSSRRKLIIAKAVFNPIYSRAFLCDHAAGNGGGKGADSSSLHKSR